MTLLRVIRRRWSRAAVLACLVLLATASCAESSRAALLAAASEGAGDAGSGESGGVSARRSAFNAMVEGLVSIGLGRRWRAGGGLLVEDDKRRVPTGPNPLHNR